MLLDRTARHGIRFANQIHVQHLDGLVRPSPQLPARGKLSAVTQWFVSATLHGSVAVVIVFFLTHGIAMPEVAPPRQAAPPVKTMHFVFLARASDTGPSGGGGGGGNRQNAPIRRAEGVGHDAITLRVAKPQLIQPREDVVDRLPGVLLDARPLASGSADVPGLPEGGVPYGTSLGPGSGGGVGDGTGTGIGSGTGPGVGPGSGGGIGGGVYRAGGAVTPPRLIAQVTPKYTDSALLRKIQGTVVLDVVVKSDGLPGKILVTRSLDPGGLDEQAIIAARGWRFEPGRLAGAPVDVLVTLILDFRIQ